MRQLLVLLLIGSASLAGQEPPSTVRLTGIAINAATDRPLASVQVRIGNIQRVTNSEGRFVFENAPVGRQTLIASKDNFMIAGLDKSEHPRTSIDLTIRPGETQGELALYLMPAGSVTGQVLSSTGEPMQNIVVIPLRYSYDDIGELHLHELMDSRMVASVVDPTFALIISRTGSSTDNGRARTTRSDDLGRFRIYNLDPGKYGFYIRAADGTSFYYPGVTNSKDASIIDIASGGEARLSFVLPETKPVVNVAPPRVQDTGVLVSGTSSVPGVQILVSSTEVMTNVMLALVTDSKGDSSTHNLPEALYRIQAVKDMPAGMCLREVRQNDGRNVLRDGLKVQAPQTTFRITINPSAAIIRGKAGPGAVIALVPDDLSETHLFRTTSADQDAAFELRCVEPGNYHLYAWSFLEGAAYRNVDFMKQYTDRGTSLRVVGEGALTVDLTVLDQ